MKKYLIALSLLVTAGSALADPSTYVRGMSLTEIGTHYYDASPDPAAKTEAQLVVDRLHALGVRQVNLSPRAFMYDPRSSELSPATPPSDRAAERKRYGRLIDYIHSLGMKVGIRPIFFVIGPDGKTPFLETQPDGSVKAWWHGNIQPQDPNKWFESYKTYMDLYLAVAQSKSVAEFTIGAELYSMTVGLEDQWAAYPYGFPAQWLNLLRYVKQRLGSGTRVMYDINFTDDKVTGGGFDKFGGEFERWRYRLVDLANPTDPQEHQVWKALVAFWTELDAVGIDLYRSLASPSQSWPKKYGDLVKLLKETSDRYATQMDNALYEIEGVTKIRKDLILKEIGYRSVTGGFVDPFTYAGSGELNLEHQAAAYEAIFLSFWEPGWDWFKGVVFWDASVDQNLHGPLDIGFSPIGKAPTEAVIQRYF